MNILEKSPNFAYNIKMKNTSINVRTPIVALLAITLAIVFASLTAPGAVKAESKGIPDIRMETDSSLICMVTDRFMGSEQLPVDFEGKTYYGCCGGCVNKIINNESVRTGKDPISGAKVDKATAVIGVEKGGAILYFESEETLKKYSKKGVAPQVE